MPHTATAPQREAWMTEDLAELLKQTATGNTITCEQVQQFAARHSIEITKMKPFVDALGITVSNCRGLCAK